jgi:hypothetical protein
VKAIDAAARASRSRRGLEETLQALIEKRDSSEEDIDVLRAAPVEQYEALFRSWRGHDLNAALDACLGLGAREWYDEGVAEKASVALKRIAKDGLLNAWRVERYLRR